MPEVSGVVCISSVAWGHLKIAPQQTMKELSRWVPVLFVERATSVAGLLVDTRKTLSALRRWLAGPRTVGPNLTVVTPPPAVPWCTRSLLANRVTMALTGRTARKAMRRLGWTRPVVWSYLPQGFLLRGTLGESRFVYDVIDEYSAFPNMDQGLCAMMEEAACRCADVVFAISTGLVDARRRFNPNIHHVPIGAEVEPFFAVSRADSAPSVLASLPRPIVGYYGMLNERVDYDLCVAAAEALPDWSFVYFGPTRPSAGLERLAALPNVHLPGPLAYGDLPQHAVAMDVLVLPYADTRFNRFIFPNKIFEYLATGRPVVTTAVPAVTYLADMGLTRVSRGVDGYVAALRQAVNDVSPSLVERRRNHAAENSWELRAKRCWRSVVP